MRKTLKIFLIAFTGLFALLLVVAGIVTATFDPNDYKPTVIRLVKEKTQRTLTIPGVIKLSVFPKLGVDLGRISLSERNDNSEFAVVDHAELSLALFPLLSKQFVVDRVRVDGLRATIQRNKDGSTNIDDLFSTDKAESSNAGAAQSAGKPEAFSIDGIQLTNAHVVFDDRQQARNFDVTELNLDAGKIASGVASKLKFDTRIKGGKPDIDARVSGSSGFMLDFDNKHYVLKALDAELKGSLAGVTDLVLKLAGNADMTPTTRRFTLDGVKASMKGKRAHESIDLRVELPALAVTDAHVRGGKLNGELKLLQGARNVHANFSVPNFDGTPQAFRLPAMTVDAAIKNTKLDAKLQLSGAMTGDIDKLLFASPQLALTLSGKHDGTAISGVLNTPLSANLKTRVIELPKLAADVKLPNPAGGILNLKANGNAILNLGKETASAALTGNLDQSVFNAKLGMSDFSPLSYTFDIGIDRLDFDRYKSKAATVPTPAAASTPAGKSPSGQAIELSVLQNLHATGSVRIGSLKVANIQAANVHAVLRANSGKLDINPLAANLYGGNTGGALSVIAGKPARYTLKQTLTGVQVGPLLKDAIGKDPVEGKGNVQLDVTTAGTSVGLLKKGLNGSARLELRDGAIRGVNIAQTMRSAKAALGQLRGDAPAQTGTGSRNEKTDFSELSGSFRITNGVARNDDLLIKSPLIRVAGAGDINLGDDRLDYLARTTVVSTLQGQGGPELQALKGLTVPVRLSGPFDAISWRVDLAGMASEMARQKFDERKDEVKAKAQKSLEEQKDKVRDQLKEQLKGLLGR